MLHGYLGEKVYMVQCSLNKIQRQRSGVGWSDCSSPSSKSLLNDCLLILSITNRGLLKSPSVTVDLLIFFRLCHFLVDVFLFLFWGEITKMRIWTEVILTIQEMFLWHLNDKWTNMPHMDRCLSANLDSRGNGSTRPPCSLESRP